MTKIVQAWNIRIDGIALNWQKKIYSDVSQYKQAIYRLEKELANAYDIEGKITLDELKQIHSHFVSVFGDYRKAI